MGGIRVGAVAVGAAVNLKDLLESSLKEVDRQIQSTPQPSIEQMFIWNVAVKELAEIKRQFYYEELGPVK